MKYLEETRENLYAYYLETGKSAGLLCHKISGIHAVSNPSSAWPHYLLGGDLRDEKLLEEISTLTDKGELPPFWIRERTENFSAISGKFNWRLVREWTGMYLELGNNLIQGDQGSILIREVNRQAELIQWLDLLNASLMSSRKIEPGIIRAVAGNPSYRMLLAYVNGVPAGTLQMFMQEPVAGLYMVSVPEEFRRMGTGSALTKQAIRMAADTGCRLVVLHATEMGLPLYRKLGFLENGMFDVYWKLGMK